MSDSRAFVDRILREGRERRAAEQAERRAEFFAGRSDVPDLEFRSPYCSVCGAETGYDGDSFWCEGCGIVWPKNGYGHESVREDVG